MKAIMLASKGGEFFAFRQIANLGRPCLKRVGFLSSGSADVGFNAVY